MSVEPASEGVDSLRACDCDGGARDAPREVAMAQMFYLASPATEHWVYVGGTHEGAGALHCLKMDAATGALSKPRPVATLPGGGPWFALSPSGRSLYASVRAGKGPENNYCAAFAIDRRSGQLDSLGQASTVLPGSAHCSVSPSGRHLVASMMTGGGAASFALAPGGEIEGGAQSVIPFPGGGSFVRMTKVRDFHSFVPAVHLLRFWLKERRVLLVACCHAQPGELDGFDWPGYLLQDKCMAHSAQMTMDGAHVLCPDIGADKLWLFDLLPEGRIAPCSPSDHIQLPGGSGPRHLAAHPNGRWLYLICEISCQIVALSWSCPSGAAGPAVAEIGSVSTLPADWPGTVTAEVGELLGCTTAHIVVSPDGRFVYGSNRVREGEGSIVCFAVDGDTGALSVVSHTPSGGITPRNFCLSPSGDWLVAANASSNNVSCSPS